MALGKNRTSVSVDPVNLVEVDGSEITVKLAGVNSVATGNFDDVESDILAQTVDFETKKNQL